MHRSSVLLLVAGSLSLSDCAPDPAAMGGMALGKAADTSPTETGTAAPAFPNHRGFVGVTGTTRTGGDGMGTFVADCQALWPRSHVCSDTDVVEGRVAPVPGATAWIVGTMGVYDGSNNFSKYGIPLYGGLNCAGTGSMFGYASSAYSPCLADDGTMTRCNCTTGYVIACCQ